MSFNVGQWGYFKNDKIKYKNVPHPHLCIDEERHFIQGTKIKSTMAKKTRKRAALSANMDIYKEVMADETNALKYDTLFITDIIFHTNRTLPQNRVSGNCSVPDVIVGSITNCRLW